VRPDFISIYSKFEYNVIELIPQVVCEIFESRLAEQPENRDARQKSGLAGQAPGPPQPNTYKAITEITTDNPVQTKLDSFSNSAAR
jgi:hypothetical protein